MTYEEVLLDLAERTPDLVVLTAENRAAIRNAQSRLGNRFIDVGIAEQTMIGIAAGFALRGRIPVVHALAAFLSMRAFEFIRTDVGVAGLPVKIVGGVPGFLSEANGPTHQALEDIALMRGIPGMHVCSPADAGELVLALPEIIADPAPWYLRYNAREPAMRHAPWSIGRAEVISEGNDVAILVHGMLLREAAEAASILQSRGVSVHLVNMRTLKPADKEAILLAAAETDVLVTIEDHFLAGGLYSIVAETLVEHQRIVPVVPLGLKERWFRPALLDDVLRYEGFTGPHLASTILRASEQRMIIDDTENA